MQSDTNCLVALRTVLTQITQANVFVSTMPVCKAKSANCWCYVGVDIADAVCGMDKHNDVSCDMGGLKTTHMGGLPLTPQLRLTEFRFCFRC